MSLKSLHLPKSRILVLEQNCRLRADLCSLLTDAGYALTDGEDGAGQAGPIDLALAAPDAWRASKAALDLLDRPVPVILLIDRKAWFGFDFFDAANELGAAAVLQRPFPNAALLRLVANMLAEPGPGPAPIENDGQQPGLAELLIQLETPNFA
ncbi:hypothetical protein [Dongia sedimenti]|uniref:Response regulatory domain-containing protein n=1 Tax=Dongia sedimenti TaxID=3064282 RepID=A0ABU0YN40_9PROT|nr:hypothetical protein [Rhodospirillaceae bacterium R-7]